MEANKQLKGDALYNVDDINHSLYAHNARYTYVPVRTLLGVASEGRTIVIGRREFWPVVKNSVTSRGQAVTYVFLRSATTGRFRRRAFLFTVEQAESWLAYFPLPVDFGETSI